MRDDDRDHRPPDEEVRHGQRPLRCAGGAAPRLAGVPALRLATTVGLTVMPAPDLLQPFDDHAVVGLQAALDDPQRADAEPGLDLARLDSCRLDDTATLSTACSADTAFCGTSSASGLRCRSRPGRARTGRAGSAGRGSERRPRSAACRSSGRSGGRRTRAFPRCGCSEPSARIISTSARRSARRLHAHLPAAARDFEVVALADAARAGGSGRPARSSSAAWSARGPTRFPAFTSVLPMMPVGRRVDLRVAQVELGRVDRRLARPATSAPPGLGLRDRRLVLLRAGWRSARPAACTARRPARTARGRLRACASSPFACSRGVNWRGSMV